MFGKVICVPHTKGGYLDFWGFVRDTGQSLTEMPNGSFREIVHTRQEKAMNDLREILRIRKRDLMREYWASYKKTAAHRWYGATKAMYDAIKNNEREQQINHTTTL